jgi:hypothetical protein
MGSTPKTASRDAASHCQGSIGKHGEGQPLTRLNAIALAGRWYTWFVKQHEDDPGPAKYWREMSDYLVWNVLRDHAPETYEERPGADRNWEWAKEPEVRDAVRPQIAELARVALFSRAKELLSTVMPTRDHQPFWPRC